MSALENRLFVAHQEATAAHAAALAAERHDLVPDLYVAAKALERVFAKGFA